MSAGVWAAVAVGGAAGSVLRYGIGLWAARLAPGWPWGTFSVNVLGSLLIGLLAALLFSRPSDELLRAGLMTGVVGGFTTFSAFSLETLDLFERSGVWTAAAYVAASLGVGLAACAVGLWLGRAMLA